MATSLHEICDFLRQNTLFEGFSERQLGLAASAVHEVTFQKGEIIIQESETSDQVYIIKEGMVDVEKYDLQTKRSHRLAVLNPGAVIGEITLLDNAPRSATVRAVSDVVILYGFSITKLKQISDKMGSFSKIAHELEEISHEVDSLALDPPFYSQIIQNLAKGLGARIRNTNEAVVDALRKELHQTKARVAMGIMIITILVNLSLYIVVLKFLENFIDVFGKGTTIVDAPLIAFFAVMVFIAMTRSGYPLAFYGINLKNWRASLLEGVLVAIPICGTILLLKWLLIHFNPAYAGRPLMSWNLHTKQEWLLNVIYLLFVPLQELIVRGGLQSSFQTFFLGKYKNLWAILISNLLFSVIHFHISALLGVSVMLPGLLWGWLYSRYPTLVGVSVSHQICGVFALTVVGIL